jgi:fructokinase
MIIVCGEALMDVFVEAPHHAASRAVSALRARIVPGGSPFNVAIGLARLGVPAALLGGLSRDHFGTHLRDLLDREGVETGLLLRSGRPTTLSVVATDEEGVPSYSFHGEGAADRAVTTGELPPRLPEGTRAIVLGSYTLAVEPVGSALLALAEREGGHIPVSLDPNLRPGVVGDLKTWRLRFERFVATASILKASEEDLALGFAGVGSMADLARRWLAMGPDLVVVTRGPAGAIAFTRNGATVEVPAPRVTVADTVGAGDSFHAALLARLHARGALESRAALLAAACDPALLRDALACAATAAAITCARPGADLPRADDVDRALTRAGA